MQQSTHSLAPRLAGTRPSLQPVFWLIPVGLAISIGFLVVRAPYNAIALTALVGAAIAATTARGRAAVVFVILAAVPVIGALALHAHNRNLTFRRIDDLVLLIGFVFLAREFPRLAPRAKWLGMISFVFLAGSEAAGAVGALDRTFVAAGAAFQDLRWLGAIGLGLALASRLPLRMRQRLALYLLAGWNIANVTIMLIEIAKSSGAQTRLGIPITAGLFGHPTHGTLVGTALFLFVICDRFSVPTYLQRRSSRLLLIALALTDLALSTRFKAALGLGFALLFIFAQGRQRRRAPVLAIAFAFAPLVIVPVLSLGDTLTRRQEQIPFITAAASHAGGRVALISAGGHIASAHFPFGKGLGSFGSDLDTPLENETAREAGLDSHSRDPNAKQGFRSDSQVAHVLAERGDLGLILWILGLSFALGAVLTGSGFQLYPTAMLIAAIAVTPVAPTLHSGPDAFTMFATSALLLSIREPTRSVWRDNAAQGR